MQDYRNQSHVKWECKYHIVWCPKYRRKKLYGKIRKRFGEIIHDLCRQKGVTLIEGHAQPDHIHLCLSIPPKYCVAMIGSCQGRCRFFQAAMAMFFPSACFDLFGFRYTIFSGVQSRVDPDQRSGCSFLAVS